VLDAATCADQEGEQAVDPGGHGGAEHCGAEGAAELHRGGLQAACHAGQFRGALPTMTSVAPARRRPGRSWRSAVS